jgi:hypothetical protein
MVSADGNTSQKSARQAASKAAAGKIARPTFYETVILEAASIK